MNDPIRPDHYRKDVRFDAIDVALEWDLSFCLGSALKYIQRNGRKRGEPTVEGLNKAIEFITRERDRLIERQKRDASASPDLAD